MRAAVIVGTVCSDHSRDKPLDQRIRRDVERAQQFGSTAEFEHGTFACVKEDASMSMDEPRCLSGCASVAHAITSFQTPLQRRTSASGLARICAARPTSPPRRLRTGVGAHADRAQQAVGDVGVAYLQRRVRLLAAATAKACLDG